MRRATLVSLAVVGVLVSGCEEPNTTSYDPVGVAAESADMVLVAPEQVTSCVESTKFGAYVGDAIATARWDSAGQSEVALADTCDQIGHSDPAALATIHRNWIATEASMAASTEASTPAPAAAAVADCDPAYPDMCLPVAGPDLDCGDVGERRFTVLPPDPHGFDGNHDGVGCEVD